MVHRSEFAAGGGFCGLHFVALGFTSLSTVFLLSLTALVLLPGCGVLDYFTDDDDPHDVAASGAVVSVSTENPQDGIDSASSLLDLERYLLDQSPALDRLRSEASKVLQQDGQDGWIPGSTVSDSAPVGPRDFAARDRERNLSIDWRPASIFDGDLRQKSQRSRSSVAFAKLHEAESKLLRLLREEWSELWFQRQVVTVTTAALDELQRLQEDELDPASPTAPILIDSLRTRWNDRVDGIAQEASKTRARINSLLGRPSRAALPSSDDPGDIRFHHVDQLTERRLHPREIIADERLALASVQLEETDTGGWPEFVVGAHSQADADAPVTGSDGTVDSWTFTVGVEFPLGRQGRDYQRRAARSSIGSARALQMMARRSIEDEIAAARAQLVASLQRIDEIENDVIPTIAEVRSTLPDQVDVDRFEARLRVKDGLLEAQLALIRAKADRARARFSLIDLLGLEKSQPTSIYSRVTP
ncbi:MAG: TolC family protein [Planctomycetota bacterium]|nr:TolC family protein [Planctomycetota bacterium]